MGELALEVAGVDHTSIQAFTAGRLHQFSHTSADNPVLSELRKTIQLGWPESKVDVAIYQYFDFCDELIVQDSLVFKGPPVVVPMALCREMI